MKYFSLICLLVFAGCIEPLVEVQDINSDGIRKILVIGSSNSSGNPISQCSVSGGSCEEDCDCPATETCETTGVSWAQYLQDYAHANGHTDIEVVWHPLVSVGGSTLCDPIGPPGTNWPQTMLPDILAENGDAAIVELGQNDFWRSRTPEEMLACHDVIANALLDQNPNYQIYRASMPYQILNIFNSQCSGGQPGCVNDTDCPQGETCFNANIWANQINSFGFTEWVTKRDARKVIDFTSWLVLNFEPDGHYLPGDFVHLGDCAMRERGRRACDQLKLCPWIPVNRGFMKQPCNGGK